MFILRYTVCKVCTVTFLSDSNLHSAYSCVCPHLTDHRGQHRDVVMPDLPKELARRLGPKKKHRDLSSRLGSVSTKGSAEEIARRHKMEKERLKKKRSGEFVRRGPR